MADITSASTFHASSKTRRFRLVLVKGDHHWTFQWEPGGEGQLIDSVSQMAGDTDVELDWYDAAMVCHHVAEVVQNQTAE